MRSATRSEVLAVADWCAQRGQRYRDQQWGGDSLNEPLNALAREALRVAICATSNKRALGDDYALASSILYAAALEGGPLPAGWRLVAANARAA